MKYFTHTKLEQSFEGIWLFEFIRDFQLTLKSGLNHIEISLYDQTWEEDCFIDIFLLESTRIDFWGYCPYLGRVEFSIFQNNNKDELIVRCGDEDFYYRVSLQEEKKFIYPGLPSIKPIKDTWYTTFQSYVGDFPLWCEGEWCPADSSGHLSIKLSKKNSIQLALKYGVESRTRIWIDAIGIVNNSSINFSAYSKTKGSLASRERPIKYRITFSHTRNMILIYWVGTRIANRASVKFLL